MTQHKVISDDSMSAMDEISKVLGKDAVIISTKKNNGKIEIVGSNDIKHILKTNRKSHLTRHMGIDNCQRQFSKEAPNLPTTAKACADTNRSALSTTNIFFFF